jgi:toxin CcdB
VRQFEVFDNPSEASRQFAPYVAILQSHYLDVIDTVVVAPLIRDAELALSPFDVAVDVLGETLILAIAELGSIEKRRLAKSKANVALREPEIRRALDRLFTGF